MLSLLLNYWLNTAICQSVHIQSQPVDAPLVIDIYLTHYFLTNKLMSGKKVIKDIKLIFSLYSLFTVKE